MSKGEILFYIILIASLFIIAVSLSLGDDDADTDEEIIETTITTTESNISLEDIDKKLDRLLTELERMQEKETEISTTPTEVQESVCYSDTWNIDEELSIPSIPTNMKLFTDYRCYNIENTPHYRLQQSAWTDIQGCRRYHDDYIVALGSYYSDRIGDRFEITLDNLVTFTVITGDMKADIDTDESNMYSPCTNYEGQESANVLEFIIDINAVPDELIAYGSLDYYYIFKGNIESIKYLGRDDSQDWDSY